MPLNAEDRPKGLQLFCTEFMFVNPIHRNKKRQEKETQLRYDGGVVEVDFSSVLCTGTLNHIGGLRWDICEEFRKEATEAHKNQSR